MFLLFLHFLTYARTFLRGVIVSLIVIAVVSTVWISVARVEGRSMTPTLLPGDLVLVDLRSYDTRPPERGDVVVITYSASNGRRFVKRVVGIPGDIVSYRSQEYKLNKEEYFIIGDEPQESTDSRNFGPVQRSVITGKVIARVALNYHVARVSISDPYEASLGK